MPLVLQSTSHQRHMSRQLQEILEIELPASRECVVHIHAEQMCNVRVTIFIGNLP